MSSLDDMRESYPATTHITARDWADLDNMMSACNLVGILNSVPQYREMVLKEYHVRESAHIPTGTDWLNRHPVFILLAEKIADLAGVYTSQVGPIMDALNLAAERSERLK